jgi:hypothetical protein
VLKKIYHHAAGNNSNLFYLFFFLLPSTDFVLFTHPPATLYFIFYPYCMSICPSIPQNERAREKKRKGTDEEGEERKEEGKKKKSGNLGTIWGALAYLFACSFLAFGFFSWCCGCFFSSRV